ncbi:kinase-like domain-containing protein [Paraphysoderma sedebokerense]|nr:kinase-like domain-containing protein [Paraphysoderma sedebokerense]
MRARTLLKYLTCKINSGKGILLYIMLSDKTSGVLIFTFYSAFGAVYRAVLKQTGFVLAIKEIRMSRAQKEQTTIEKEINMLKKCVHRNTVQYYGCCRKDDAIWILTDYCGLGSMSDILELLSTPGTLIPGSIPLKRETIVVSKSSSQGTLLDERFEKERTMMESTWCQSGLTEMEVAAIVGGALEGLKFLHDKGIIHRDLKCANILLTDNGEVKIADFGVSEQITKSMAKRNTVVGTPYWMAPEVITATDYGIQADIWSLGITVIELCDCVPPLCDLHPMRAMFQIPHLPPPTLANPEHHTPTILSFLSLCLQKDPSARATAADLLGHNFVKGFTGEQGVNGRKKVLYPRIFTWIQAVEKRRAERREKYSEVKKKEVELEVVKKVEGRDSSDEEDFRGAMKGQATIKGSAMNSKVSPGTMFVKDEDHNEMEVTNLGTMIVADDSSTSNATNGKLVNNDENAAIRAMFLNAGEASSSTTNKSPTSPTNQGLRRRQHLYSPPTRKRSPSSSSPTRARDNPNAPVTLEYLWSLILPSIQVVTNPIVNMHYRAQSHPKVGPIYRIMSSTLSTACSSVKYLITNGTSSSPAPSRSSPSSPSSQQPELSLTTLRRAPLTVVTALTASLKYRSRCLWLNYGHHLIYATLLMAMWGYHGVTMRYWVLRVEQLEGELQRMQFLRERFGR